MDSSTVKVYEPLKKCVNTIRLKIEIILLDVEKRYKTNVKDNKKKVKDKKTTDMKKKTKKPDLKTTILTDDGFLKFTKGEFCQENVLFYRQAVALGALEGDNTSYVTEATKIFNQFIKTGSSNEININNALRQQYEKELDDAPLIGEMIEPSLEDVVDKYRKELLPLIKAGSFNSFKKTKEYEKCKGKKGEWLRDSSRPVYKAFEVYDKMWENSKKLYQRLNQMEQKSGDYKAYMKLYEIVVRDFIGPTAKFPVLVGASTKKEKNLIKKRRIKRALNDAETMEKYNVKL